MGGISSCLLALHVREKFYNTSFDRSRMFCSENIIDISFVMDLLVNHCAQDGQLMTIALLMQFLNEESMAVG